VITLVLELSVGIAIKIPAPQLVAALLISAPKPWGALAAAAAVAAVAVVAVVAAVAAAGHGHGFWQCSPSRWVTARVLCAHPWIATLLWGAANPASAWLWLPGTAVAQTSVANN